ncbi:redoxin family protein [Roseobacter sp. HKCCD9010]|uniref:TlpA family protein disulfide reductase n=1 Tax=unclassified Roseobacter TaxID=196798 RepID=UPI00149117D3|nr:MULTISPECIES: TlpA disulfide reductase family protein [unclassified Roseobacter]MBF9050903.1 redoxin family protein [Rhodobacterales bacterium HKCCD4356]NNV12672.1 redoxin family protein [Roseobacter sp. HKCCD7357]NNV16616.1 redoxin family protein [Roseobacter sp. HKCCD8768]NNV26752.1 redoxin family protein [Roseobacter sp. HKCCD8192]NNV30335.1 redoxin family protein [Roseobacter sp. HKCCD9061]
MIRGVIFSVLYMALALGANAQDLEELRVGDMRGLVFHAEPVPVSETPFIDMDDVEYQLSDLQGRYILLNFWATWCAPCRHEMPYLNTLQHELGGEDFKVVTLATGRNPLPAIRRFFEETGIDALPMYRDPGQTIAREMGVFGLPITVILNPEGQEIARLRGDADWASAEAIALLRALIAAES